MSDTFTAPKKTLVERPATFPTAAGSQGFETFQHAYVVRDLDAGIETFKKYGVKNFTRLPLPPMEGGAVMKIALAWTAGQMIELIEARGPGMELHGTWLREGEDIRFHHFGYFIEDDDQWNALHALLEQEGRQVVMGGDTGVVRFAYVEAPELGHYLEYVYPSAEGKALFESVSAN
ncbi:VOC family protein [uncultured Agrobacterium sp.]|uniref:VOC family protein n=1 Tax=Novosphingobium fluoreni TaxID=1391222 RepID=UPI0025CFB20A|nr:VOC family protein [uncultured Agrobacterium sp.]